MRAALIGVLLMALPGFAAAEQPGSTAVEWKQADGAKVPVPPHVHPRLYLGPQQAAQLKARLENPVLRPVAARLESMAKKNAQYKVEWDALQFLITGDRAAGRATVQATLALLKACELPDRPGARRDGGRPS